MNVETMDVPYLAMETEAFARDPYPFLDEARAKHPWLARGAFGYIIHEYAAIQDVLRQDGPLQSDYAGIVEMMGAQGTPWGEWTERHLLSAQGSTHRRIRDALASKFTPRQANQHRDLMRAVLSRLLDEWVPKQAFDFEEFASYFPISVLCTLIGARPEVVAGLRASLEALGLSASMQKEHLPALQAGFRQLDAFVQDLVARRRGGERTRAEPDMLDDLLETVERGDLSDRELYDLLVFLFVAGFDTSKNMLTLIMNFLLDRPEIYRRCAEDYEYCRKVMEETFRYCSPATIPRVTAEALTYRDVTFPAGTSLFFPVSLAGRDPKGVTDPDIFDPERDSRRHLAFGMGMHICLGQFIARAQIHEGLHLIAKRISDPRRAGPSDWRPFYGVWGIRGLPISFAAQAKSAETAAV
jgi:cytochrome P450